MGDSLGILVSSDKHLSHVVHLTTAAHDKGKAVNIFFHRQGCALDPASAIP